MRDDDMLRLALDCARLAVQGENYVPALAAGAEAIMNADAGVAVATFRPGIGDSYTAQKDTVRIVVSGAPQVDDEYISGLLEVSARHPSFMVQNWYSSPTSRVSDFVSPGRFWETDVWARAHGAFGARYPAGVNMGVHGGAAVFVGVQRTRTDFTDSDMEVLDLIRGPLVPALAFRHAWDAAALRLRQAAPTAHALTRRESQVLALVARGWTDRRIARSLAISERTVRKHLENVSAKWGVSSRAAAVHRWTTPSPQ